MHRVDEFTFGKSSEIFAQALDEMLSDMDERCRVSAERKNKRRLAWIIDVSSRSSHFHVFGNGKIISKTQTVSRLRAGEDVATVRRISSSIKERLDAMARKWTRKRNQNPDYKVQISCTSPHHSPHCSRSPSYLASIPIFRKTTKKRRR